MMKTARLGCIAFLLSLPLLSLLGSCVVQLGPGGAAPGLVYSNVTYPNELNSNMSYRINFQREDIEILGPVDATSVSRWYLFVASEGDSGYAKLMEKSREMGGDGVMNVTVDTKYQNVLIFYARVTTKLTAVAYRYRRDTE